MLKCHHLINKSFTFLTDQIFSRYSHVVEKKFRRVAAPHTHFIEFFTDLKTGQVCRNHEKTKRTIPRFVAGSCKECQEVGLGAVCDVGL